MISAADSRNAVWLIVGIGSNLGPSLELIHQAFTGLKALVVFDTGRLASVYESTPIDCPPGSPRFLNTVFAGVPRAGLSPEGALDEILDLEHRLGRRRSGVVNEPRLMDLDLIAFGKEQRSSSRLSLPHPRASGRRFVLEPLSEILPGLLLPGWEAPVESLLEKVIDQPLRKIV